MLAGILTVLLATAAVSPALCLVLALVVGLSGILHPHGRGWVDILALHPSEDISSLAAELVARVPRVVRYLLRGLGSEAAITELTSYLLFDPVFCGRLIDLGRRDVMTNQDELRDFFTGPPRVPQPPTAPE